MLGSCRELTLLSSLGDFLIRTSSEFKRIFLPFMILILVTLICVYWWCWRWLFFPLVEVFNPVLAAFVPFLKPHSIPGNSHSCQYFKVFFHIYEQCFFLLPLHTVYSIEIRDENPRRKWLCFQNFFLRFEGLNDLKSIDL